MSNYITKYGESIFDVCLNSTGTIESVETILNDNVLNTWTPILQPAQSLIIPEVKNGAFYDYLQSYPAVNNTEINNLDTLINSEKSILNAVTPTDFIDNLTGVLPISNNYISKFGETIFDITLNSTGTVYNLQQILTANLLDSWTSEVVAGQTFKVEYKDLQTNVLKYLENYPAVNNTEITNLDLLITDLISNFANRSKSFQDDELFDFEDNIQFDFENL